MQYGQWIGRTALALIFLFNALGIVDQTRPAHELAAHGAPAALVPTLIMAGRALQLVAGIALVIGWHERVAALLLALFLIPATLTAHDFWASPIWPVTEPTWPFGQPVAAQPVRYSLSGHTIENMSATPIPMDTSTNR